jgi:hypothetical protein
MAFGLHMQVPFSGATSKEKRLQVKIALRLRRETTMTLSWIATQLHMGASGYVANCLRRKS